MPSVLLLSACWIASLAILLLFLESWFGVPERDRFVARRASGAYGICSVFLIMRGPAAEIEKTIRSVFSQSYPFVELFLIFPDEDSVSYALAQEFRTARSHVAVRPVPVPQGVDTPADRIRALEHARPSAKGRWYVVLEAGVVLDQFAVEASMEFAGSGEVSALALRPGTQASSFLHRVLAPSMEYLYQIMRVIERRRAPKTRQMSLDAPYQLLNRESFEVIHKINRMPGILNEAGWTLWSYQMEGLRTFDGDGSRWLWRETAFGSWPDYAGLDRRVVRRSLGFMTVVTLGALIPVAGLVHGFYVPLATFREASILALSAISYALMTISYFLYARKLHAATWFAPLWFLVQPVAAVLTIRGLRRATADASWRDTSPVGRQGPDSSTGRKRGRGGHASETSRRP
ncbi:MAG TPA: glycosyltransferase family A protein [Terriglobia bacterium]|nr:glycosyltransferase family A protein [Terriglobia bacterium]